MIELIDYGAGNLRSVEKALIHIGADVHVTESPKSLEEADAVVLPGVGAFDDCMIEMGRRGLVEPLRKFMRSGRPFLGICVGYQALFEGSEEPPAQQPGLGVLQGRVKRFSTPGLKVPQIGWNRISLKQPDCPLFEGIPEGTHFYFVHGYYPKPEDTGVVAAETEYGETFASAVWKDNVFATQFHPEKSQQAGLRLLQNFVNLVPVAR